MTAADFARIERELGVTLSADYREMLSKAAELKLLQDSFLGRPRPLIGDDDENLLLDADWLIKRNLLARDPVAAEEYVFPGWWRSFMIIGGDGADVVCCIRTNGVPEVWSFDVGSGESTFLCKTIAEYVAVHMPRMSAYSAKDFDADTREHYRKLGYDV